MRKRSRLNAGALLPLHIALSLVAALRITGSSTCPTPAQIEAELAKFPDPGSPQLLTAILDPVDFGAGHPQVLRVQLYDARGIYQGERQLPAGADCEALARAVGTVLRGMELSFGEILPPPHLPPPPQNPEIRLAPELRTVNWEVGGSPTGVADISGGLTWGGRLLSSLGFGDFPLRAQLSLEGEAQRQIVVGLIKHGEFWRLWAAPGGQLRLLSHPWLLVLELEVPLGAVRARGLDFENNQAGYNQAGLSFDWGVTGGLRAGFEPVRAWKLSVWLDARITAWPTAHLLVAGSGVPPATLPQWEGILGLGLSWYQR